MIYIDPGSGSMAFQFLIAGFLGFVLTFWRRIRTGLSQFFGHKTDPRP